MPDQPLRNQVAVVAGATRGAGRGIARMLGVGRAVAALAADPGVSSESGGVFASLTLATEYGVIDLDGRQPDWGSCFPRNVREIIDRDTPTGPMEPFAVRIRFHQVERDPSAPDEAQRLRAFLDRHRAANTDGTGSS